MTDTIRRMLFLPTVSRQIEKNNIIPDMITQFTPYMLTNTNKSVHTKINNNNISSIVNSSIEKNTLQSESIENVSMHSSKYTTITPTQPDSLFWCMYIAIHTYDEYLMIHNKHNMIEMEWKQQLSKQITECPAKLKHSNHKITKVNIQEILSDFMTSPYKTNKLCLIAITVYYNIHIILMTSTNNMRMEFLTDMQSVDTKTFIVYKNDRNHYHICNEPISNVEYTRIRNNSFLIENSEKPLKSVGSYKLDDLVEYAKLLGVYNDNEKYKKTELYKIVGEYITKYNIVI